MYKLLLCWRYLRTRFLAFVCIVSVMLGVATLVVVNSVMGGFATKLKERLHGLLSDVVIETPNYQGFPLSDLEMLKRIRESSAGKYIAAMTPTVEVVAMLSYQQSVREEFDRGYYLTADRPRITRPVHLIGVDPKGRSAIGGFAEHLVDPQRRKDPSFSLTPEAREWFERMYPAPPRLPPAPPPNWPAGVPFLEEPPEEPRDPKGIIVGFGIGAYREKASGGRPAEDRYLLHPGDVINIVTIGVGKGEPTPVPAQFVVCDFIKTEMAEYDGNYVFVPLEYLQALRGMPGKSTHIQIKLTDYAHAPEVVKELRRIFPDSYTFQISRWEDKQGAILAAIDIERGILNLLLFMIVGVAGFSILAIFSMIVVEKTRDIGILKSLGASNTGVMSIFLGYGLLLGVVGSVLGTMTGLAITYNINEIEHWLSAQTGREIFDRNIYYFDKIPVDIQLWNVIAINIGAVAIATFFSILPAFRAAMLHPVRALRYE